MSASCKTFTSRESCCQMLLYYPPIPYFHIRFLYILINSYVVMERIQGYKYLSKTSTLMFTRDVIVRIYDTIGTNGRRVRMRMRASLE